MSPPDYVGTFHVLFGVFLALLLALAAHWLNSQKKSYPPGPPTLPLLGNIFKLPAKDGWLRMTEWKRQYGDLIYLHGLGKSILVLNSIGVIDDLLNKGGINFSHRPDQFVVGELFGGNKTMALKPHNQGFVLQRKLVHYAFGAEAVKKYIPAQEDMAALCAAEIIDDPKNFRNHIHAALARFILNITYGINASLADEQYINHAEATMKLFSDTVLPGKYIVDTFPFFRHFLPQWMPGVEFWKVGHKGHDMVDQMFTKPFEYTKRQIAKESAHTSFVKDILDEEFRANTSVTPEELEEACKWAAGSMFAGGQESATIAIIIFIMLMALNPDKQRKARQELLDVIGEERLPMMDDRASLPYLNAVIKETMRWQPINPLGLPRRTAEDTVYNGYFIPANTVVIANVWAITSEPSDGWDARDFAPERFMQEKATVDPYSYTFGFGRRACPGRFLADNNIFLMFATILAGFEISLARDSSGKEIPIIPNTLSGFISFPEHFECDIRPLSKEKAAAIRAREAGVSD